MRTHIYAHICTCLHLLECTYTHSCTHVCLHACMHTHTHISAKKSQPCNEATDLNERERRREEVFSCNRHGADDIVMSSLRKRSSVNYLSSEQQALTVKEYILINSCWHYFAHTYLLWIIFIIAFTRRIS